MLRGRDIQGNSQKVQDYLIESFQLVHVGQVSSIRNDHLLSP